MAFNQQLESVAGKRQSHLCVGLDPDPALAKKSNSSDIITRLHQSKVAATAAAPFAAAFKPNAAFFEEQPHEFDALAASLAASAPGVLLVADAKRGDIGNTSRQYAHALLRKMNYDAVTVNPLMGHDSVQPFLEWPEKGVFLLCLTSNPGAADFLLRNDLYKRIAEKAMEWNRNDNVGLVVGATRPEYAADIRAIAPDLPFLIPGIGAQGGQLAEVLDAIGARKCRRFLINASRSIMYPGGDGDYPAMVANAARNLRDEISAYLQG